MILLLRSSITLTFTRHCILDVTGAVAVAGVGAGATAAVIAPLDVEQVGLRLSHGQQHYQESHSCEVICLVQPK
jgi:hypothetical protein